MATLFLIFVFIAVAQLTAIQAQDVSIGVDYGLNGDNLPSPAAVVAIYKQYGLNKMRIFQPDPAVLEALRGSNIEVIVGTVNNDIPLLASSQSSAQSWFSTNVQNYLNDVVITHITVGNEIIPGEFASSVLPAILNLKAVVSAAGLQIKVTTAVSTQVLQNSFPPSSSQFSAPEMSGIVKFLQAQGSELLVNVYPYYAYTSDPNNVRLDYAQFTADSTVVQDGDLGYANLFDALMDGLYWALEKEGVADVGLVVSETGWPHDGGASASIELASTYNKNLVKHVRSGSGTPKRPDRPIQAFIFAMFDEDQKPAGFEQFWGFLKPDGEPNYNPFA